MNIHTVPFLILLATVAGGGAATPLNEPAYPGWETLAAPERKPLVARPLVFARIQSQYALHFNYLHRDTPEWYWIDRPLFADTSWAPVPYTSELQSPAFAREVEIARQYGIDGFAHLTSVASQKQNYAQSLKLLEGQRAPGFSMLLEVSAMGSDEDRIYAELAGVLERAFASPKATRINGRILVTSYGLDKDRPEAWGRALARLRERYGADSFLLVADITSDWWPLYVQAGSPHERIRTLEQIENKLRAWLDATDGLMFAGVGHATDPTRDHRFDPGYYDIIIRSMKRVLDEPGYRGKYFGLSGAIGYFNPVTGATSNEQGTRYLRQTLEMAAAAQPDFIILPEWNEANENTSIQPTLYNGTSTQRVMASWMRQLKGEAPASAPASKTPDLILSYRPFLALGEKLEFEALAVPEGADDESRGSLKVKLRLKNLERAVVAEMPEATLEAGTLKDVRWSVPTETLANHRVLVPSFEVVSEKGGRQVFEEGMMAIHIDPSMNWNRKWVKIPLRDLLVPKKVELAVDAGLHVKAFIDAGETIAAAEIVADGVELYAADREEKYKLKENEALVSVVESTAGVVPDYHGRYRVEGGEAGACPAQFGYWKTQGPGQVTSRLTVAPRGQIFVVAPADKATIKVETSLFETSVAVSDLAARGIYSKTAGRGTTLTVAPFRGVPELPKPWNEETVSIDTTVRPIRPGAVMQLRVVTTSGRSYRSWPFMAASGPDKGAVTVPVYSETEGRRVSVGIDRSAIRTLTYTPSASFGDEVPGSDDLYFNAKAGGSAPWSTVGVKELSDKVQKTTPGREKEGEAWTFDGVGNFLYFPPETLPRGAFRLSFEVKPLSPGGLQPLFSNYGYSLGAFQLSLKEGRLSVDYIDRLERVTPYYRRHSFDSKLALPPGQWSQVEVIYDLERLTLKVKGRGEESFPLQGKGWVYSPLVFGLNREGNAFHGALRSISIQHHVVQ